MNKTEAIRFLLAMYNRAYVMSFIEAQAKDKVYDKTTIDEEFLKFWETHNLPTSARTRVWGMK